MTKEQAKEFRLTYRIYGHCVQVSYNSQGVYATQLRDIPGTESLSYKVIQVLNDLAYTST